MICIAAGLSTFAFLKGSLGKDRLEHQREQQKRARLEWKQRREESRRKLLGDDDQSEN